MQPGEQKRREKRKIIKTKNFHVNIYRYNMCFCIDVSMIALCMSNDKKSFQK